LPSRWAGGRRLDAARPCRGRSGRRGPSWLTPCLWGFVLVLGLAAAVGVWTGGPLRTWPCAGLAAAGLRAPAALVARWADPVGGFPWEWAVRVGEAAVPGPPEPLTVWFANITTVSRLLGLASALPSPGALLAQEARLDFGGRALFGAGAVRDGLGFLPGPTDAQGLGVLCSVTRGAAARCQPVALRPGLEGRLRLVCGLRPRWWPVGLPPLGVSLGTGRFGLARLRSLGPPSL